MLKYLFGSNDNTHLVNEPTIDYNHTLPSQGVVDHLSDSDEELSRHESILQAVSLPTDYPGKFKTRGTRIDGRSSHEGKDKYTHKPSDIPGHDDIPPHELPSESDIEDAISKLQAQNKYLSHIAELVEQNDDTNYEQMYHDLRNEYLAEMDRSQTLYKGYYKLILKYKELKRPKAPASKSSVRIREKLNALRESTREESTRRVVDEILASELQ